MPPDQRTTKHPQLGANICEQRSHVQLSGPFRKERRAEKPARSHAHYRNVIRVDDDCEASNVAACECDRGHRCDQGSSGYLDGRRVFPGGRPDRTSGPVEVPVSRSSLRSLAGNLPTGRTSSCTHTDYCSCATRPPPFAGDSALGLMTSSLPAGRDSSCLLVSVLQEWGSADESLAGEAGQTMAVAEDD